MKKTFIMLTSLLSCMAISSLLVVPIADAKVVKKKPKYRMSISAIPGADEKNFANPTSRCLTASMKALNAKAMKQLDADVAKYGKEHEAAAKTYKEKLTIVWAAMEEPYCGYGSRGLSAVTHSFQKSVEHIRAEFMSAVK